MSPSDPVTDLKDRLAEVDATETLPLVPADKPRALLSATDVPDRIFRVVASGSGTIVLIVMGLVGLFLAIRGYQALSVAGPKFLAEPSWNPNSGTFGIAAVLSGQGTA